MWPTATQQLRRNRTLPSEETLFQGLCNLKGIIFPAIMALIHQGLVRLGLVTCQVGEEARKSHLGHGTIVPRVLAEEVCRPLCGRLARVERRVGVHLRGH